MQAVAMGNEHPDVVSTLASRLTRLERKLGPEGRQQISDAAGGKTLGTLAAALVQSLDSDAQAEHAGREAGLSPGEEPTDEQLDAAERAMISEALAPFHDPQLRTRILDVQRALEQVIDETTPDQLLAAGFDEAAREKARTVVDGFETFIEENREEIEALKLLYSRPRRAGLRYTQVKDLAQAIKRPPLAATPELVWKAYEALEPSSVRGGATGGKKLADVISLVRHAIDHAEPLEPYAATVEERYEAWISEQEASGAAFTPEQRRWLDAIRDHVATALRIERDDFDDPPLNQLGGLGRVHQVFGDRLPGLLDELNERLAA